MKERYYSLDVFRGATVAFMILVNNQAGPAYPPLDHAPWHGLTPTDLVFPFFLFAVGNALSFVMPRFPAARPAGCLAKDNQTIDPHFFDRLLIELVPLFAVGPRLPGP